jgi:hypothetical protein
VECGAFTLWIDGELSKSSYLLAPGGKISIPVICTDANTRLTEAVREAIKFGYESEGYTNVAFTFDGQHFVLTMLSPIR